MTDSPKGFEITKKRLELSAPALDGSVRVLSVILQVDGWLSLIQGKEAIALDPSEVEQLRLFLEPEKPEENPVNVESYLERLRLQPSGDRARGAIQEALRLFVSEHIGKDCFDTYRGVLAMAEKARLLCQLSHMSAAIGRVTVQLKREHLENWHWIVSRPEFGEDYPPLKFGLEVAQAACGFLLERRSWYLAVPKEVRELARDMVEAHASRARRIVEPDL